ncbi:Hypothetical_protein [Hexamita inflata]|uniref:Hypothetical_protein n=1 Tax=Hexamita inflata TaxID=28002 RepID=A0AA86QH20_9EUKA|nr:Hypothetical protein HINF_LOCUS7940 [Hexamita inflata]CAI9956466.1 Hypothetical protein HINF_LOCUS44111 [Hexamita inflata]
MLADRTQEEISVVSAIFIIENSENSSMAALEQNEFNKNKLNKLKVLENRKNEIKNKRKIRDAAKKLEKLQQECDEQKRQLEFLVNGASNNTEAHNQLRGTRYFQSICLKGNSQSERGSTTENQIGKQFYTFEETTQIVDYILMKDDLNQVLDYYELASLLKTNRQEKNLKDYCRDLLRELRGQWSLQDIQKLKQWFTSNEAKSEYINNQVAEQMNLPNKTTQQIVDKITELKKKYEYKINGLTQVKNFTAGPNTYEQLAALLNETPANRK